MGEGACPSAYSEHTLFDREPSPFSKSLEVC